jgi:D-lactate dehydrogenase
MPPIKIAFFDTKPYDQEFFQEANKSFGFEISFFKEHLNERTAFMASGSEVVCAFVNDQVNNAVSELLIKNGVKLIALRSAGYNNVDLKSVYKKIHVVRVPAYSPYAVAEHALALILSLNRKTHLAYARTRDNNFNISGLMGFDLHGKTAGVIGTGRIGKVLLEILNGFGMKLLAYDHYPDLTFAEKLSISYTDLTTLYQKADIISLHCPLNKETFHLIDQAAIELMKPGVMIINTSRGQLIDTKALIKGLKSKKIGAAGLDVYEEESDYFFEDLSNQNIDDDVLARLLTFNNVLITSHQAFFTREALANIAKTTLENIKEFFTSNSLSNEICYQCSESVCSRKETGRCF